MKLLKSALLFTFVLTTVISCKAQSSVLSSSIDYEDYKEFCAILLDGTPVVKRWSTDEELALSTGATGVLSVATIDRMGDKFDPINPVGFKLAIKNHRTNALWMYSNELIYDLDIKEVIKECEPGDQLIFITVDKKYQLPRHELRLNFGC